MRSSNGRVERHVADDRRAAPAAGGRALAGRPSANSSTVVPARGQRLGDLERVHDAAARLDRVGEHRDPQRLTRASRRAAARRPRWSARRSRPPRAAPRPGGRRPAGRRRVPHTCAITGAPARDARSARAASPPAGSGCEPWPSTTSSSTQPTPLVAAASRASRARTSRSTIGCGRPAVYSSSPRSKMRVARPSPPSARRCRRSAPSAGSRIVTASWASEPPENSPSRRRRPRRGARRPRARAVDVGRGGAGRGRERAGLERGVDLERRVARRPSRRTRRPRACRRRRRRRSAATTSGAGGLETSSSVSVSSSAAEHRASPARNMIAADLGRQVAAADADDLRHADAGGVEQARRLLRARARPRRRCRRGPDAHDVGEAEPDAAEHRGAAPRAHDQQPALAAAALERDLVARRTRGRRRGRRACPAVSARCASSAAYSPGTEIERDVRAASRGAASRASAAAAATGRRRRAAAAGAAQLALGRGQRVARRPPSLDRDHDVGRRRVAGAPSAASAARFAGRAHRHLARAHAVAPAQLLRDAHQPHAVDVAVAARSGPPSSCGDRRRSTPPTGPRRPARSTCRPRRRARRRACVGVGDDRAPPRRRSTNRAADSIFGPMLPGGNSPVGEPAQRVGHGEPGHVALPARAEAERDARRRP